MDVNDQKEKCPSDEGCTRLDYISSIDFQANLGTQSLNKCGLHRLQGDGKRKLNNAAMYTATGGLIIHLESEQAVG